MTITQEIEDILDKGKEIFHSGCIYDDRGNSFLERVFEYQNKFHKFEYVNGTMSKAYEVKKVSWMEYKYEWEKV
jgi:hypothetical protein